MSLTPEDKREIEHLIADRLEAESIADKFTSASEAQREEIAHAIATFMSGRQASRRRPENVYTPRWTQDMADVNTAVENSTTVSDQRGHKGPTLPRWIDQVGGHSWLDPDDPQIVHFRGGGGGADCMFDYLVSACWTGTEGQVMPTVSGCTYKLYSTVQGACTDAATNFSGTKFAVIYVCPGRYVELVSISSEVYIVGAGTSRLGTTLADTSGSSGVQIVHPPSIGASDVISVTGGNASGGKIMNLAVIGRSSADATAMIDLTGCTNFELENVSTVPGNAGNIGIKLGNPAQKVTNCASFNAGIGLQIISQAGNGREDQVHGFRSYSNTVGMDLQDGFHLISDFVIDSPDTAGIQMRGSAAKCKLTDGIIFDAAEGIDVQDGTKFICDTVLFSGCTTGIGIDTSVDDDLQIVNCEFDLGTTGTGISFPATDTTDYAVIKGNRFWDSAGAGTPITNAPRGWAMMSDNWYNGGPLHASAVVNGGTLGVIRPSRETAREIEWDQFYILFGATLVSVAAGQIVLTASSDNYVEVDSAGTVTANTTGFTAGQIPLYYADMATSGPFTVGSRAPVLSHGGLASGTVAAPTPHDWVGTHHTGDDDYTLTPNVLGLGVSTGDIKVYSDAGITLVGEWDGALGHIGIGGPSDAAIGIYNPETFTNPAASAYGANISPTFRHTGAVTRSHYGAYIVPAVTIAAAGTLSGTQRALLTGVIADDESLGGTVSAVTAWSPLITTLGTVIVTTARGIHLTDPTVAGGSIGTFYGIDIPALSAATTNIGIRNLATSRLVGGVTIGSDAAVSTGVELEVVGQQRNQGDLTFDGIAAPGTPAADDLVVYNETATDLLKAKDDNGAVYALTHKHLINVMLDGTVTTQKALVGPMPHAGTITDVTSKTCDGVTIGATAAVMNIYKILAANINTDGGTTSIFTVAPTITNGNMRQAYGAPDLTTTFAAGDYFAFANTQVGTNATFIQMGMAVRYT